MIEKFPPPKLINKTRKPLGDARDVEFDPGDPVFIQKRDIIAIRQHADSYNLSREGRFWRAHSRLALGCHFLSWGEAEIGDKLLLEILMNGGYPHDRLFGDRLVFDEEVPPGVLRYEFSIEKKDEHGASNEIRPLGVIQSRFEPPVTLKEDIGKVAEFLKDK